jgi:hypothetical protein
MSAPLDFTVSAGHAEYWVDGVADVVVTELWPSNLDPYDDFADEDEMLARYQAGNGGQLPPGDYVDLGWEHVVRVTGTRAGVIKTLLRLVDMVGVAPSGDDDVFDYWPSGSRFALGVAAQLGEHWVAMVTELVRAVAADLGPDYEAEILDKVGVAR